MRCELKMIVSPDNTHPRYFPDQHTNVSCCSWYISVTREFGASPSGVSMPADSQLTRYANRVFVGPYSYFLPFHSNSKD